MHSNVQGVAARDLAWKSALLLVICSTLLAGCRARLANTEPYIEFTSVPRADEGGPEKLDLIEGRVVGARPELQVVLYARSGIWYVQPYADEPYTQIRPDSKWRGTTHLGTEYAALLVEPGFKPPPSTEVLPSQGDGVISVAIRKGEPVFWLRWWFLLLCVLACLSAILAVYSYRLRQTTRQLHLRFEERLAERTRIAQELHDTLLQGVISASMQLHVAVDRLPDDLPAKPSLARVLQVMSQVLEEGRNALQRLRASANSDTLDFGQAFSQIQLEFADHQQADFQIRVKGHPRPLHPLIRDEIYRIGREALVNAFRHSRARHIEAEVEYKAKRLRVLVWDDGCGIDPQVLRSNHGRNGGLSGMREGAERIGARLKLRSRKALGTKIELSVPGHVAYLSQPTMHPLKWFAGWQSQTARPGTIESKKGEM
ncbi:MAG TPA: sensor histidine kinase [Blastocatellia bacterium]|nr:sensor histidine kinase [Blastocatellia bacterium]